MFELASVAVLARLAVGWVVVDAYLLGWLGRGCALPNLSRATLQMIAVARRRWRWGGMPPRFAVVPALTLRWCSAVLDVSLGERLGNDLHDESVQGRHFLGRLGYLQPDVSDEMPEVLDREGWAFLGAHLRDEQHELDDAVRLDGAVQAVGAPEGDCVFDDLGA